MKSCIRRLALSLLAAAAVGVFLCGTSSAQENAELTGTVKDPSGAVVPNARVTLTNASTAEVRAGTTNGAGMYDFPALHNGIYNLKVAATGFEAYAKTGITMDVAATVREDVVLALGASTTTVTVQANALHLQTETNEVSNLITGEQLTQLGTNGRSMLALATLGTGVSTNMPSFNGVSAQGANENLSFNGMRPGHNNWLIDGGEVYDRGSGGRPGVMPSPDVLAEFQTLDSNYQPDYGIASGGTMVMALKSGSKNFHGGAWEFNRNDAFDAQNYFTKQAGKATPELRLNIFGGEIGGPLFIPGVYPKDRSRTFFFYSEEWRRYIQGANPSASQCFPGQRYPDGGSEPELHVAKRLQGIAGHRRLQRESAGAAVRTGNDRPGEAGTVHNGRADHRRPVPGRGDSVQPDRSQRSVVYEDGSDSGIELDVGQRNPAVFGIADAADLCAGRRGAHRS